MNNETYRRTRCRDKHDYCIYILVTRTPLVDSDSAALIWIKLLLSQMFSEISRKWWADPCPMSCSEILIDLANSIVHKLAQVCCSVLIKKMLLGATPSYIIELNYVWLYQKYYLVLINIS
jgi:hypothetical protein